MIILMMVEGKMTIININLPSKININPILADRKKVRLALYIAFLAGRNSDQSLNPKREFVKYFRGIK